jgi:hypothetical protein
MLLHCVDEDIELSPGQAAEVAASTSAWIEQTIRDGVAVHGAYLEPVREARTVRLRASAVLVTDGPFAETKEQISIRRLRRHRVRGSRRGDRGGIPAPGRPDRHDRSAAASAARR